MNYERGGASAPNLRSSCDSNSREHRHPVATSTRSLTRVYGQCSGKRASVGCKYQRSRSTMAASIAAAGSARV